MRGPPRGAQSPGAQGVPWSRTSTLEAGELIGNYSLYRLNLLLEFCTMETRQITVRVCELSLQLM